MSNDFARWLRGRPARTENTVTLWATAFLDGLIFCGIFMGILPWRAHRLLPQSLSLPPAGMYAGALLIGVAVCVLVTCVAAFVRRGRGTQLPSEAPKYLVTDGLFGVLRNPIIAAEVTVVWGEALYFGSLGLLLYAVTFSIFGHVIVRYVEEPELRRRFGESYEAYCRDVPRWMPRRRAKRAA
jgi:protein-S-isoprenylcysteine O-methyltransferase Ste14